jgi:hypothetical protein
MWLVMQFVYEPHIAPKIEQWAENFIAKRRARRRQRVAVPVSSSRGPGAPGRGESLFDGKNWDDSSDSDTLSDGEEGDDKKVFEMESLVNRNILSWRSGTDPGAKQDGLRHRNTAATATSSTIDEAGTIILSMDYILTSHCSQWAVR